MIFRSPIEFMLRSCQFTGIRERGASPGPFKLTTRHCPIIFGLRGLESGAIDVCVQNKICL